MTVKYIHKNNDIYIAPESGYIVIMFIMVVIFDDYGDE